MNTVIVIPARLESERLAAKLLLELNGKTVLQHVYNNLKNLEGLSGVYIATDSDQIFSLAKNWGAQVIMTSSKHKSGTDRVAEAVGRIECDYVINVQGDEPLIQEKHLRPLLASFGKNPESDIFTLYETSESRQILDSLTDVKLVADNDNYALYFSRLPIPFRDLSASSQFKKHIGVYGFKKDTLLELSLLEQSRLEKLERLEQLRWLENGYKIKVVEVESGLYSIDTKEDYEKVKKILDGK